MNYVLDVIKGLSVVLENPALGGGSSIRTSEASEILRLAGTLAEDPTTDAVPAMEMLVDTISAMAEGGRGPTPLEWSVLRACQAAYDASEVEDVQEETVSSDPPDAPEEETPEETQIEE